jgi:hypothetical protein
MRNLSELNINEGGKPIRRPPPASDIVSAFQDHFEVVIPDDYLRLLQHANGGHPEVNTVDPIGRPGASSWAVNWFYHLDANRHTAASLWHATDQWRRIYGHRILPFASDGFDNQFFLDFRVSPPSVRVLICDEGSLEAVDIAPSFAAFVDALYIDPDML